MSTKDEIVQDAKETVRDAADDVEEAVRVWQEDAERAAEEARTVVENTADDVEQAVADGVDRIEEAAEDTIDYAEEVEQEVEEDTGVDPFTRERLAKTAFLFIASLITLATFKLTGLGELAAGYQLTGVQYIPATIVIFSACYAILFSLDACYEQYTELVREWRNRNSDS